MKAPGRDGEPLVVQARVVEALPNALYKLELLGERRSFATAHVSGASSLLRLLPGETVVVELMPYDASRGRILRRAG